MLVSSNYFWKSNYASVDGSLASTNKPTQDIIPKENKNKTMSSTEKIIKGFPKPTITPITGQPAYKSLKALKLLLSFNASSIHSHLCNGALGILWITVSDAVYNTLSLISFFAPINLGIIMIILNLLTQFHIQAITDTHTRWRVTTCPEIKKEISYPNGELKTPI